MSALAFLTPDADAGTAVARSSMERTARAAGATFETREGWSIATAYASPEIERSRLTETVGFADRSSMRKLELHGEALASLGLKPGIAEQRDGAWWCPVTPARVLVLGGSGTPELPAEVGCRRRHLRTVRADDRRAWAPRVAGALLRDRRAAEDQPAGQLPSGLGRKNPRLSARRG